MRSAHLPAGVLQHDESAVGGALADGDRSLGTLLVCCLRRHLPAHDLASLERGICRSRHRTLLDPLSLASAAD